MKAFLLLNVALAFYNVGTIWAHEADIFRSWQLAGAQFHAIQASHWRKIPYWVLTPAALGFAGALALVWYRPAATPGWAVVGSVGCQATSILLTALFWGRWQAALSHDASGADSPFLSRILRTHWIRTALITAAALLLLTAAIRTP